MLTEKIMADSPMPQPSSPDSEITAPRRSTALRVLKRLFAVFVIAGIGVWGLHWYATGGAGKKDSSARNASARLRRNPSEVLSCLQEGRCRVLSGWHEKKWVLYIL